MPQIWFLMLLNPYRFIKFSFCLQFLLIYHPHLPDLKAKQWTNWRLEMRTTLYWNRLTVRRNSLIHKNPHFVATASACWTNSMVIFTLVLVVKDVTVYIREACLFHLPRYKHKTIKSGKDHFKCIISWAQRLLFCLSNFSVSLNNALFRQINIGS